MLAVGSTLLVRFHIKLIVVRKKYLETKRGTFSVKLITCIYFTSIEFYLF